MGNTTLLAISTLTSEINFYTRLMKMRDRLTGQPIFTFLSVELACAACKAEGKASECVHMLHLVPRRAPVFLLLFPRVTRGRAHRVHCHWVYHVHCHHGVYHVHHPFRRRWQSADRHVKLKTIMQDRPDLIESELSGLAFDSLQQVFKPEHIKVMFDQPTPPAVINEDVHVFIDPAAGGPYSDYAIVSVTRQKGLITVSPLDLHAAGQERVEHDVLLLRFTFQLIKYAILTRSTNSEDVTVSSLIHAGISSW